MPKVIKPSQYNNVSHFTAPIITDEEPASMTQEDKTSTSEQEQVILSGAFEKAKQIVEAANAYSVKHIKETNERMDEECAQTKQRSYDEGYAKGLTLGREEGLKAGYEEGLKNGYEEGSKRAKEENQDMLDSLTLIFESVENAKKSLIQSEEEKLSDLALEIAETILQKSLASDKKAIDELIESVIEANHNKEWIKINISNEVYDELKKVNFEEKLKAISDGAKLYRSRELSNSECIIETQDEVIDASVETQLNKIKTVLKK